MRHSIPSLKHRPRRLRASSSIRDLVRETTLSTDDLIMPLFIIHGEQTKNPVPSMPGIYQHSIDQLDTEIEALLEAGVTRVILFGIPATKDATGSDSYDDDGIIQRSIRYLKKTWPELYVITDVCMCEYTDHGHCGILEGDHVDNDRTLAYLQKQVISHARAGVNMVAPSGMMDGMVGAIRGALDENGFARIPIMSYSAKYASAFYGPFRDAAESAPRFGDRQGYQMDPSNVREALCEVRLDVEEGADIVMVKPAIAYMDVIRQIRDHVEVPLACYQVSGEYSMIKAAGEKGWIDETQVMMEVLVSLKRAGADMMLTYFAQDAARILKQHKS